MSEIKVNKITPTADCGTVTLGDSGDTVTIPSGATLDLQGTSSGIVNLSWDTTVKTASFTASAGNGYFVNTTSGAITVTLPASPSAGDIVGVKDYAETADTNNITIARNGSKIQGVENDFTITTEGLSIILLYVDSTKGWLSIGQAKASDLVGPLFTVATGGTVTTCGNDKIHTFTSPGTFTVTQIGNSPLTPAGGPDTVDYLVVAGGAGGGGAGPSTPASRHGGGGGAGGYRASGYGPTPSQGTALTVSVTSYPITVGSGGSSGSADSPGSSGSNTVFSTITSAGGGGGGGNSNAPSGGSGGGGAVRSPAVSAGSGNTPPVSPPQGFPGGNGGAFQSQNGASGGGGGASEAGTVGPAPQPQGGTAKGGPGGDGFTNLITGVACSAYAGGGSGAGRQGGLACRALGGGGVVPGGNHNGVANTGGGGVGQGINSGGTIGSGGSGIVVIRYQYQ